MSICFYKFAIHSIYQIQSLNRNRPSYKLILIILLNVLPLFLSAESTNYPEKTDSIRQVIRLRSYILLDCQTLTDAQFDTLLGKKIPLAFVTSGEINGKLQALITRIPKQNLPVVLINETGNTLTGSKSDFIALSGNELNNLELTKNEEPAQPSMSCREFLRIISKSDSVPSLGTFVRIWERTGKLPNFISANATNILDIARVVASLNGQPKIFGVVRNGDQLLADVSWKEFPNRRTNGYFSFPIGSPPNYAMSPYKAGFQFSPDIILPTPEKLRELKIFNAVPLKPEFGLTDDYLFAKEASNSARKNESDFILYGLDFARDEQRGHCGYFSGQAYLDCGLSSKTALKPNFSITAWIKPTQLDKNNCILGKGKDFVLKLHNGILTFTMQGIKDYYSKIKIPKDSWSFISLVHTGTDNHISFYLNGELTDKINLLSKYTESDYTTLIGSNLWEESFVGYIGELKIWNRELNEEEVRCQYMSSKDDRQTGTGIWLVWTLLSAITIAGSLVYILRRKRFTKEPANDQIPVNAPSPEFAVQTSSNLPDNQEHICCFGGLKVYNSEGKDISQKFSPKLKQLFVLIFLHSVAGQKGISSKELSDCLWPGVSPQNAKNIRGTNIQNLKALLAACPSVKLGFQDKLWKIDFIPGYFVDYDFVEERLNQTDTDLNKLVKELPELLAILKQGTLFQNMSESWVDPYIDRMSNRIIEFGLNLFRMLHEEKFESLLLEVAEVISINDPLNEPALRKKINILTRQGKLSLAHSVFDNFVKLYYELYQEKYPGDFKSLLIGEPSGFGLQN